MGTPNSATMDAAEMKQRGAAVKNGGPPKRTFREFQFVVTPVLLVEEDGAVPFAHAAEQVVLRGLAELQAFIDSFPAELEQLNAAQQIPSE